MRFGLRRAIPYDCSPCVGLAALVLYWQPTLAFGLGCDVLGFRPLGRLHLQGECSKVGVLWRGWQPTHDQKLSSIDTSECHEWGTRPNATVGAVYMTFDAGGCGVV